jgi:hypothetical protein
MSQPFDLEELYNAATTLLVQFNEEQKTAFDSLIALGQDSVYADTTLAYLVGQYDTKSAIERHRLKDIFKTIGPPAIPAIEECILERGSDDEDRHLKQSLWVLGEIGGDSIVAPVGQFVNDHSWQIRSAAFTALGKSKSGPARDFIISGLQDTIASVRKSAYYALSQIASVQDIELFMRGIEDPYYGVRYSALNGLIMLDSLALGALNEMVGTTLMNTFYGTYGLCAINASMHPMVDIQNRSVPVRYVVYSSCEQVADLEQYLEKEQSTILRHCIQKRIGELKHDAKSE